MTDAESLEKPGTEEKVTPETPVRIKVQAAIYRIESLIELKTFSPERLWREFFEKMARELGSIAEAVKLMQANGDDNAKIFRLLKLSGYSDREVVEILQAAGWTLVKIVNANFGRKEDFSGEEVSVARADLEALDFLLGAGLNKASVVSALFKTDCLNRRTIYQMIAYGWTWQEFFRVLIEAECFNIKIYQMLLGLKDKQKKVMFSDSRFMALMSELKISDSGRIILLRGMGKRLHQVYKMCLDFGWTEELLIAALIEADCSAGTIVCAYTEYALEMLNEKENQMERNIKDHTDAQKDTELFEITGAIGGEMIAVKAKAIAMLQKMVVGDREVITQLLGQELTNMRIIDLLSAAGWTPERTISGLVELGKSEFLIAKAINELSEDYEFKGNNYWEYDRVKLWKNALKKFFSARDIADAIKI